MYVCMYAAAIHPYIDNAFLLFNIASFILNKNSKEFLFFKIFKGLI